MEKTYDFIDLEQLEENTTVLTEALAQLQRRLVTNEAELSDGRNEQKQFEKTLKLSTTVDESLLRDYELTSQAVARLTDEQDELRESIKKVNERLEKLQTYVR